MKIAPFRSMKQIKYFLTLIAFLNMLNLAAQTVVGDTIPHQKLPVQAFAAMPVFVGFSAENAFPHERTYRNLDQDKLNLAMKNCQVYSLYGAIPIVKKTKGFAANANFGYNLLQDKMGVAMFKDSIIANHFSKNGESVNIALNVSQQILLKKWNKKLRISASYNISGRGITRFEKETQRGLFTTTYPFKMTKDKMFLLGVLGTVGKDVRLPVLPIVGYFTRLTNHLNVELLFPVFGQLRYVFSPRSAVLLGAKVGNRSPFLGLETPILQSPDDALVINSQNLRYYFNVEKAVNNYLWFHGEVGYNQSFRETLNTHYLGLQNGVFAGERYGYMYAKVGVFVRPVFGTIKTK